MHMRIKNSNKVILTILVLITFLGQSRAQEVADQSDFNLNERVGLTPKDIILQFQEMGMDPVNHILTKIEQEIVEQAFDLLPPLHQKILKEHLYSISFLDNMPNTALTSPVDESDEKMFTITFRSEILHQTISEWATWKEKSLYEPSSDYSLFVEAGELNAIVYVLLHEATHVLDAALEISPKLTESDTLVVHSGFTQNIWTSINMPREEFRTTLLETTRFRGGGPIPINLAPEVYKKLQKTPFVSLYGMASWFEDLAELVTIYHLSKKLNQPYQISIMTGGVEVFRFDPIKNKEVRKRFKKLNIFYSG